MAAASISESVSETGDGPPTTMRSVVDSIAGVFSVGFVNPSVDFVTTSVFGGAVGLACEDRAGAVVEGHDARSIHFP